MDPSLTQDERYEMMRDMAYIAVVFATGKRCDDIANLLISQMVRFPDGSGIMFGFQFHRWSRGIPKIDTVASIILWPNFVRNFLFYFRCAGSRILS